MLRDRPHGNCELFILDTSSLIFTAQSMECCLDKFIEKMLSRTGRVGKREPWWWQLCYAATSILRFGSYWERGMAQGQGQASPHNVSVTSQALVFHSLRFQRQRRGRHWGHCFQQKSTWWASPLWCLHSLCSHPCPPGCARSLRDQDLWKIALKEDRTRVFCIPAFRKRSCCCLTLGNWINLLHA